MVGEVGAVESVRVPMSSSEVSDKDKSSRTTKEGCGLPPVYEPADLRSEYSFGRLSVEDDEDGY